MIVRASSSRVVTRPAREHVESVHIESTEGGVATKNYYGILVYILQYISKQH